MDVNVIEALLSGVSGAGAVIVVCIILIRKILLDLGERVDRTDAELKECRRNCDARLEKGEIEFRQIISALNEIKVQIARSEVLGNARSQLAREVIADLLGKRTDGR